MNADRPKSGVVLIADERLRQIEVEDWTPEHDDCHDSACLAVAAACYALNTASRLGRLHGSWKKVYAEQAEKLWPFDSDPWWKPSSDPVRDLVKAGALIAAEIDRLQRAEQLSSRVKRERVANAIATLVEAGYDVVLPSNKT